MKQHAYIIRWHGPFHSRQDLKEWELEYPDTCSLYLIRGKNRISRNTLSIVA